MRSSWRRCVSMAAGFVAPIIAAGPALAGNGANFVLYNQQTEEQGETEVNIFSDFSNVGGGEFYSAQLVEIEYGVTDLWTTALYLEGAKIQGEDYAYGSFRLENRVRLFREETWLNPVLYAEYEQKEPESRFIRAVTGRTDEPETAADERTEHELELKQIFGRDLTDRLNVAVNLIEEVRFDDGRWEFGYVAGLNYALYKSNEAAEEAHETLRTTSWDLEKLTLGVEFYGGLGDATRGLTLDPDKTEQYAGVNLVTEFENRIHVGVGGAFGLTRDSEDAILRLTAGYEFE